MRNRNPLVLIGAGALAFALAGCHEENGAASKKAPAKEEKKAVVHKIEPGIDYKKTQEIFIKVKPGETIEFAAGKFEYKQGLSISVKDVTIKGQGMDKTILSFKGQEAGSEGISAKDTDGLTFDSFAVEDTKGDAIKVTSGKRIFFKNIRTEWTGEVNEKNGAYGLYPVQCEDVLIDHCVAIGASDAGIYVGQSKNIIVRHSKAERNVAGIEIENSINADVYENEATNNAGGLLVFDLPTLQVKNGKNVRLYKNKVYKNNHKNFAPAGNIVATVPPGTGLMLMATDFIEVFDNDVSDNQTCNLSIVSFISTGRDPKDADYDPFSEGIYVHDNRFSGGGNQPGGALGTLLATAAGKPLPDIVYDGVFNPKKAKDGKLPSDLSLVVMNNGDAKFINLRLDVRADVIAGKVKPERDVKKFAGERKGLPGVTIAGVN